MTTQENLSSMFNAATMGTFTKAAEESIHAAIEGKLKTSSNIGGTIDSKKEAMLKTIASLKGKLEATKKVGQEGNDGQRSCENDAWGNGKKCRLCGLVHGSV